ncbi:MAG: type I 3-dehydroquinate dehydratase, partial [Bacteroidales bacterium]|nr:type I 3-dehydroquinate dehydratase [Bacteroidales bacterium]
MEILAKVEMAEIRLDLCDLSLDEIEEIFSTDTPTVATCRVEPTNYRSVDEAQRKLSAAIKSGAAFVDVEIEAPKSLANAIKNLAREYGTRLIRSYHDYEGTDSLEALKAMVGKCLYHGAELVKIVTTAKQESDGLRVLSLYDSKIWAGEDKAPGQGDLIAFCMGEVGRQTRLDCLKFGAPYTYAALSQEETTASGQWTYTDMCQALYGGAANKAMDCAETSCKAAGSTEDSGEAMDCAEIVGQADIDIPCSKSFAQRAIITAALAQGTSSLDGYTPCSDNEAAIAVAQALGAKITRIADRRNASGSTETGGSTGHMTLQIEGIGAQKGSLPMEYLHTGESGLLTRLMIPLCAMLSPTQVRIEGEKTLLKRPLAGVKDMMDALGAQVENLTEGKEKEEAQVPLCVSGPLNGGRVD